MSDDRHARVSRRAYELWEQDGGEHGRHEDHWRQADLELQGGEGEAPPPHTQEEVAASASGAGVTATGDELAGLPQDDGPAAGGTTTTGPAAVEPAGKRAAAKPTTAAAKPRKPKAR